MRTATLNKTNRKTNHSDIVDSFLEMNLSTACGLRDAAETLTDMRSGGILLDICHQRRVFARELASRLITRSSSRKARAYACWWDDFRHAEENEAEAVLAAAYRGELEIRDLYISAIHDARGTALGEVLRRHLDAVHENSERLSRRLEALHAESAATAVAA